MKIAVSARTTEEQREALARRFPQHRFFFEMDAIEDAAPEIEVWGAFSRQLEPDLLHRMSSLRWVQLMTAGVDELPFDFYQEHNILVTNTRGMHTIQVSECVLTFMLQLARQAPAFFRAQQKQKWEPRISRDFIELHGKTVGIAGLGAIGQAVAKRCKAFGMRVVGLNTRGGKPAEHVDELLSVAEKDRLIRESDFLVLILPLTPETRGFIGARELTMMKSSAFLINVGRGPLVDEAALIDALRDGEIAGAGLDVFKEEPLPEESSLWERENVIITPHIGGNTPHYMDRALEIFAQNLAAYPERDEMINIIDPDRKY